MFRRSLSLAMLEGFLFHLSKPVDFKRLVNAIAQAIERQ
jgi:FixJ family two-component response regulator